MLGHRSFNPIEWGFVLSGLLRIGDGAGVIICGLFAYWLRNDLDGIPSHYLVAMTLGLLLVVNAGQAANIYRYSHLRSFSRQLGRVTGVWVIVTVSLITLAYLTKTSDLFSRVWAVTWFLTGYIALVTNRVVVARRIEQRHAAGKLARQIAVVGTGAKAAAMRDRILAQSPREVALAGIFDPVGPDIENGPPSRAGHADSSLPVAGDIEALTHKIEKGDVDEVIIALDQDTDTAVSTVLRPLSRLSVDVRLAPDTVSMSIPVLGLDHPTGVALFDLYRRPMSVWNRILKRLEDMFLGSIALVLLSPLLAVIAILIRLDSPGPVLFRQQRLGFHNNRFTMLKFRTMTAEASAADGGDPEAKQEDEHEIRQATRNDPRVTRVGRFLRKTSLDELPQILNVLKGDMSLVGPRPHAVSHDHAFARLVDDYIARHRVKPGITGWAQIHGFRGETDTEEKIRARVEHDLYYIDNWSLWLDIKILILTVIYGFVNRNAY